MTDDVCHRLQEILEKPRGLTLFAEVWGEVDALSGAEECIGNELVRAQEAEDWTSFDRYLFAASRHPDFRYVAPLCSALQRKLVDINSEDIVELLGDIADPQAVPYLVDALWWQPDWDEFFQLGKKCVWALGQIGNDEAIAALRDVAAVGPDILRLESEQILAGPS